MFPLISGTFTSTHEEFYENVGIEESYGDDGGWSSSEFESYDDDDDDLERSQSVKRKKEPQEGDAKEHQRRSVRVSMSPDIQVGNA